AVVALGAGVEVAPGHRAPPASTRRPSRVARETIVRARRTAAGAQAISAAAVSTARAGAMPESRQSWAARVVRRVAVTGPLYNPVGWSPPDLSNYFVCSNPREHATMGPPDQPQCERVASIGCT